LHAAQSLRVGAFVVAFDGAELRLERREGLQRAEVGGRLHGDHAAGVDEHLAYQVEPLLRAGGDEHLRGLGLQPQPAQLAGHPLAQRAVALAGGVLQRLARVLTQHAVGGLAHRFDRKGVG
jgi:hypothetical protein